MNEPTHRIKDPYFEGFQWIDLGSITKELNKERELNGLIPNMDENDLEVDEDAFMANYCRVMNIESYSFKSDELFYEANMKTIRSLKQYGNMFYEIDCSDFISNYDELSTLVTDADKQDEARQLQESINELLWKYGGRHMGDSICYEISTIEINGQMCKYWIDAGKDINFVHECNVSNDIKEVLSDIIKELYSKIY